MGLLDDVLGQLAGGSGGRGGGSSGRATDYGGASSAGGADMSRILMMLLPVVLAMLSNRGGRGSTDVRRADTGGGGLGDLLGSILGAGAGGAAGGGLGGLLEQFARAGFGSQANSWVGTGANEPLPPEAAEQVFGRDGLAEIARRAGLSEQDTSRGLAALMPDLVDRVTPDGRVPDPDALGHSIDALARRMGG
jgi:uncharacterized protein YidB (DUF937 family)